MKNQEKGKRDRERGKKGVGVCVGGGGVAANVKLVTFKF